MAKKAKSRRLPIAPSRQTLTIMFIDVAGFSLAVEGRDPVDVFVGLKAFISSMRAVVRSHGGIVDKVLGDGLLCYFGYDPDGGTNAEGLDHVAQALKCATELQRYVAGECIKAHAAGLPVFPIRIGMNTAPVYVGDLGDDDRTEFTVIGDGVNYAKRIEDSCDVFMLMMSETVKAALGQIQGLTKRAIQIKHHDRLFDVYEFNPFVGQEETLNKANTAYQTFRGLFRTEQRLPFRQDAPFDIHSDYGPCAIMDVSLGGFQVRLDQYLARGVHVKLFIAARKHDRMAQYLNLIGLTTMNCLVKWGRPIGEKGFLHGLQILNLTTEQKELVFSVLKKHCEAKEAS